MIHGNLKPENFLYEDENDDSIVKITDVGLYTILDKDLLKHSIEASSQYCCNYFLFAFLFFFFLELFLYLVI